MLQPQFDNNWKNTSQYSFDKLETKEITKLEASTKYEVRAILITNSNMTFIDDSIPKARFATTCKGKF